MKPTVSVIIPVYNGAATLRACLASVLAQAYPSFEVIVVDNNSTDTTADIIKSFGDQVRSVFLAKRGRGNARNAGIAAAHGDSIVFTDCDCIASSDWLACLVAPLLSSSASAVTGFHVAATTDYWARQVQQRDQIYFDRVRNGEWIHHVDTKNFAIDGTLMRAMLFNESLQNMEDYDFCLRLTTAGVPISFAPNAVVAHHHRSSLRAVIATNLSRGYWIGRVQRMHHSRQIVPPMGESFSLGNAISFPIWLVGQLVRHPAHFPYLFISEISWRLGSIWQFFKL